MKRTCNQCHRAMPYSVEITRVGEEFLIPVCANPACPAYALLQISAEQMPKEDKPKRKKK